MLLGMMGQKQNYRFTGSGRLVNKNAFQPPRPRRNSVFSDDGSTSEHGSPQGGRGGHGGGRRGRPYSTMSFTGVAC